jgi:hypothetical protein
MNAAMAYSIFAVGAGCFVWMLKYYGSVVDDDDDLFHVWSTRGFILYHGRVW